MFDFELERDMFLLNFRDQKPTTALKLKYVWPVTSHCYEVYARTKDFIFKYLYEPVERIYFRLAHVIAWLPAIWQDRDFDYAYLFYMLEFKFKRIRKDIASSEVVEEQIKEMLEPLDRAIFLLHRINNQHENEYEEIVKLEKEHEEKYGELKMSSTPSACTEEGRILTYELHCRYSKCTTEQEEEEARKESVRIHNLEEELVQKDIAEVCDIIKNKHKYWWT
jgi:hypothetical protein